MSASYNSSKNITPIEKYNELVQAGVNSMLNDIPDYRTARNCFKKALKIKYDEEISELVKECDTKLALRLKFNNMLRQSSLLSRKGNRKEAVAIYLRAIQLDPAIELSRQYHIIMRNSSAPENTDEKAFKQAEKYFNKGLDFEKNGQLEKALSCFQLAFTENPAFKYADKIVRIFIVFSRFQEASDFIIVLIKRHRQMLLDVEIKINKLKKNLEKINSLLSDIKFVESHKEQIVKKLSDLARKINNYSPLNKNLPRAKSSYEKEKENLNEAEEKIKVINREIQRRLIRIFDPV